MPKLDKEELKELWLLLLLLLEDPQSLDDQQIERLVAAREEVGLRISGLYRRFPGNLYAVQRYRRRKTELAEKPTQELEQMLQEIWKRRGSFLRTTPDEEVSDSFFESPPIDSDESIIEELLEERHVTA